MHGVRERRALREVEQQHGRQLDREAEDDVIGALQREGSAGCETERDRDERSVVSDAWLPLGQIPGGWQRVQAICDYVNGRIQFRLSPCAMRSDRSEGHEERVGVCRGFAISP
jgi:hypothetical protein